MAIDPGSIIGRIFASIVGAILNFLNLEKQKVEAEKAASLEKQMESIKKADEAARKERAALHAALLEPEVPDDDWNTGGDADAGTLS